jgi:hypothetical protein
MQTWRFGACVLFFLVTWSFHLMFSAQNECSAWRMWPFLCFSSETEAWCSVLFGIGRFTLKKCWLFVVILSFLGLIWPRFTLCRNPTHWVSENDLHLAKWQKLSTLDVEFVDMIDSGTTCVCVCVYSHICLVFYRNILPSRRYQRYCRLLFESPGIGLVFYHIALSNSCLKFRKSCSVPVYSTV